MLCRRCQTHFCWICGNKILGFVAVCVCVFVYVCVCVCVCLCVCVCVAESIEVDLFLASPTVIYSLVPPRHSLPPSIETLSCYYRYGHFDGTDCRLFRNEDYLPPEDKSLKEVNAPDDMQVLENALVSVCPRCGEVYYIHTHTHICIDNTSFPKCLTGSWKL